MADYCRVYGVIHFTSPAGWLPVHRDQLRAQRSVTSMGKLYLLLFTTPAHRSSRSVTRRSTLRNLPLTRLSARFAPISGPLDDIDSEGAGGVTRVPLQQSRLWA